MKTGWTGAYVIREMAFDDISPIAEMEKDNFSAPEVWSGTDFLTHLLREDALYLVAETQESAARRTRETGAEGGQNAPEKPGSSDGARVAPEEPFAADEEWEDPDILGYAGVLMVPDECDITKISVRGDQRRQGIGRALLEELQRRLPAFGVRKIFLEVRKSNTAAVRLYESCGFAAVGERKKYYAEPVEDAIVMRWESGDAPE